MFEDYKKKQNAFYNYMAASLKNNKISHAYLIETNGVSYAYDLAISLAKFFLCENHDSTCCDFCNNLDIDNYPDIKVIDSVTKVIKKEQLIDLQSAFKVKPVYGKYLIYIIKDANLLNKASANTILKFLEEPSENIIAILLTENVYNVIDTIVSRCQVLSLIPEVLVFDSIFKDYSNFNERKMMIDEIIDFYVRYEDVGTYIMTDKDVYKYKDNLSILLNVGLYLYFDVLNILFNRNLSYFSEYEDKIRKIVKKNKISDIIWKIDIINQFVQNSKFNVNKELFIDNFVISLGGVIND